MDNQKKNEQETKGTRESQEAVPAEATAFSWRRLFSKKWVFPAVYMAAAALILTLVWVYQGGGTVEDAGGKQSVTETVMNPGQEAVPVAAPVETMQWPVKERGEVEQIMSFYEDKAADNIKQAALVEYGDTFTPHLGVDLARQDDKEFDVLAALSGKVSLVEKNPLVGYQVEITHPNGLVTVYQSLGGVNVQKGADVKKGDVIAKAGRNELEKDHGTHLHFEVRQGASGASVNPEQFLNPAGTTASTGTTSTTGTTDTTGTADAAGTTGTTGAAAQTGGTTGQATGASTQTSGTAAKK
ncbi:MAG: peptidase [Paenibacillaceae bacterium]|jgi:stage II sporulation protein Q|nr:peptidase [Paenibacillaceae bacterium]